MSATLSWDDDDARGRLLRVERACDMFEDAWRTGHRPAIEELLARAPEIDRSVLFRELLLLELHYRTQNGEKPDRDEYRQRFPDRDELITAVFTATTGTPVEAPTLLEGASTGTVTGQMRAKIPGYELLGELGRGAMGVVYKARQVKLNRSVAIKMILAGPHADEGQQVRFRAEAHAIARLRHSHIVQIHEIGEADQLPYFVLEFVEGGSLAQKLNGSPQQFRAAVRLVEQLARAVAYAHERGIVHRDLKPGNVLLTEAGEPKIADFGLAKVADVGSSLTLTGVVMGSPSYMAPEQARGDVRNVGPAADVYALGVILFELLTGRVPFVAETTATLLRKVESEEAPAPRSFCPSVPKELESVCLKCLEKDPSYRYPSALALADDLANFLAGKPLAHVKVHGAWGRFRRRCRRNPVLARIAGFTGFFSLVALVTLGIILPPKDDSLWRVQRSHKLVVGIDPNCPPYAFKKDGQLTGFDVELARAIAGRLGVEAEHHELYWDWAGMNRELQTRRLDVLLSATTITDERKRQVAFIEYARDPLVFTARPGPRPTSPRDLVGKVIAVQEGTTAHDTIERLQRAGLGVKEIVRYRASPEPFAAVQSGTADLALDHQLIAQYASRERKLIVVDTAGCALDVEPLGIALRLEAHALRKAIEDALRAMKDDGEFDRIRDQWTR